MAYRLAELAELVGGRVLGDAERTVDSIRALEAAGARDLSFVTLPRHRGRALASGAAALLVGEELAAELGAAGAGTAPPPAPSVATAGTAATAATAATAGMTVATAAPPALRDLLVVANPGYALAQLLAALHPDEPRPSGAHPTAVVESGAWVDPTAHLGPYAVIGAGSRVEAGAQVLAHAVVGRRCRIGERALLHPHAVLYDRTEVGAGCIVHSGAVLGADGFGYALHGGVHHKVPQIGSVVLEEDVEIGANTTIDRGTLGETRVGAGTKIDNQVMLGHNVRVGRRSILCAQVGIAGSTSIGDGVVLGARVGAVDHIEIGDGVQAAAGTDLFSSLAAKSVVGGSPAHEIGRWRRQLALLWRLDEMLERLRAIERHLRLPRRAVRRDER